MWRMLDRDSFAGTEVGVLAVGASEGAERLRLETSAKRLSFSAASQSKGERTDAALSGVRGE